MKIGELFVQLGVKADTKELTAFNQKLKETVGKIFCRYFLLVGWVTPPGQNWIWI